MKDYTDYRTKRIGTKTDYLSIACITAGFIALIAFLWWAGVMADALIGLFNL